jgi:alpha-mannosidase
MKKLPLILAAALAAPAAAHLKMPKDAPSALAQRLPNSTAGTLYYTGYSHIDFNWLWDWPDTVHTWDSTARTALNLMYRFPDFNFGETQAAAYMAIERIRPDLFEEIKTRVATDHWSLLGGMWDESDTNIPSGEGLARSFLYGQDYFQEKFGKQAKVGFLPDTFGHSRQMPQLLKQAEIDYFYFQRCPRPKHLFWWQAPDGSKVLAYSSPGWYNTRVDPSQNTWPNTVLSESGVNKALVIFGVGNHGGGPTISDLTTLDMLKTDPTFPEVKEGLPENFYQDALAERTDFPVYNEELQYTFEGCYTTHSDIKKIIRDSEDEMTVAETLAALANLNGLDYPDMDLRYGWRHAAFNQFHDIAPGTAIHSTYEEAANKQKMLKQITDKVIGDSWATLEAHINTQGDGQPLTVFNPLAWVRTDPVEATVPFATDPAFIKVTDPAGANVPVQVTGKETRDGKVFVSFVFVAENMPSMGYRVYHVSSTDTAPAIADPLTVTSDGTVTNQDLIVKVDQATGQVSRLFDKAANKEVLPAGQNALRLTALAEDPSNDAWTIKLTGAETPMNSPTSVQMLESGPVRARFRAVYKNGASTYTQDILVYRNMRRVDARIHADFQDYNVFIKSVVPTALTSPTATFDVPFAAITRPTDGHEVPSQKWMDESSGTTYGLSVLNDSKYGADVNGSTMRLSLLRGTHAPDTVGDKGQHDMAMALYPHAGNWKQAGSMRRGYEFNLPLRVMPSTTHTGNWAAERSFISVPMTNIAVTAFKRAEDGNGYILRWYEYEGTKRSDKITFPRPVTGVSPVNILEHTLPGTVFSSGNDAYITTNPYGIQSLRVTF